MIYILLLLLLSIRLYLKITEYFVNPIDNDLILGEQYFEYKNLKNQDKFGKYLKTETKNMKICLKDLF